jgi:hypothetical protein
MFSGVQFMVFVLLLVMLIGVGIIIIVGLANFDTWRKTGYCRHEFELYSTNSFGQHHWYKCKKCDEKRLK